MLKVLLVIIVALISFGHPIEVYGNQEEAKSSAEASEISENAQSNYDKVEKRDLIREPEKYKGAKDSFVTKVFQVVSEDDDYNYYLGTVHTSPKDSLTVMIGVNKDKMHTRIIKGDEIRVQTLFVDGVEYKTVQSVTNEVPLFLVTNYKIVN